MKKFKVYNDDEHFGDKCEEEFDTLKEAEEAKENIMDDLYDLFIEESINDAKNALIAQLNQAILVEEIEEEENG